MSVAETVTGWIVAFLIVQIVWLFVEGIIEARRRRRK